MDLCQFFTADACSEALVSEMSATMPSNVLDVGAGHGSLAMAAMRRWRDAKFGLVDIDRGALEVLKRQCPHAHYMRADVLRRRLPAEVSAWMDRADVLLCNPPFSEVPVESADQWLRAAGMPIEWSAHIRQRAEVIFLAHGLSLLRPGGELAMILPAAFINGHHFVAFRAWLLQAMTVNKVVELPRTAFRDADVRTFALIARKAPAPPAHMIELIEVGGSVQVTRQRIDGTCGVQRLDPAFHIARGSIGNGTPQSLSAAGVMISRGWSVAQLRTIRVPFFHTTDFANPGAKIGGRKGGAAPPFPGAPLALAGDVLMGRIGRQCHTQVVVLPAGHIHFSDCVYRLQLPLFNRGGVLKSLKGLRGQLWRQSRLRGSTVSLLSKADLLEHPVWEEEPL